MISIVPRDPSSTEILAMVLLSGARTTFTKIVCESGRGLTLDNWNKRPRISSNLSRSGVSSTSLRISCTRLDDSVDNGSFDVVIDGLCRNELALMLPVFSTLGVVTK